MIRWILKLVPPRLRRILNGILKSESPARFRNLSVIFTDSRLEASAEFKNKLDEFVQQVDVSRVKAREADSIDDQGDQLCFELRALVRRAAGLKSEVSERPTLPDLVREFGCLQANQKILAPAFKTLRRKRVLFSGQAYYNTWYLSRALRDLGWRADVLNWDLSSSMQIYYHGEDFRFDGKSKLLTVQMLEFYLSSLYRYDIFHFSNAHGISFGVPLQNLFEEILSEHAEIKLLKGLGKIITYANNGCQDGVSQTSFSRWGPESVCSICRWRNEPVVCSDEKNLTWGKFRNSMADFQCLLGGNRADFNIDPRIHEVPEFFCLDKDLWKPQIDIPEKYRLPSRHSGTICLYHAVGHRMDRTSDDGVNIKSSHIYLPLIEKLKREGHEIELLEPHDIPNKEVRYLQVQADIFLDMLTFGWFGANAREAMMLGKPVICFIRPEWHDDVRREIPDYANELPIISATPDSVETILLDLMTNPKKRQEIGRKGREFAVKWHSAEAGGARFDEIFSGLLQGNAQLNKYFSGEVMHG